MGLLSTIGSIVGIVSGIAGIGGSASAAFSDRDPSPAEEQLAAAIAQAMGIAPAALDRANFGAQLSEMLARGEGDPRFASLVSEEDDRIRNDFIQGIDTFITKNRRDRARGGGRGSINPERQDEIRASVLTGAFEDSRSKARASARNLLTAAANANNLSLQGFTNTMGALTGAGQAAGGAIPSQIQADQQQSAAQATFFGNLPQTTTDILGQIEGFAKGTNDTVAASLKNVWT